KVDEKVEEKEETKVEEKEEELKEDNELKEDEKELRPEDELEELDEMPGKPRPTFKEITAKYPNLFKDFPDLREAMGREREYTELFDTVDAAKEAKEQVDDFSYLRELVESGSPEKTEEFLAAVKEGGEENLINFA